MYNISVMNNSQLCKEILQETTKSSYVLWYAVSSGMLTYQNACINLTHNL